MLIERRLTREEFDRLLVEAPDHETEMIRTYLRNPYKFFQQVQVEESGIVNKTRPLYYAALTKTNGGHGLWTIANSNIKEQLGLFRISRRRVRQWHKAHGMITATMGKGQPKSLAWTLRMGFRIIHEDEKLATLRMGG